MRLPIRLLFFCLSLLSLPALAAPVTGLYQVREPVADQQPESRDAAMQKALQTLVPVSYTHLTLPTILLV